MGCEEKKCDKNQLNKNVEGNLSIKCWTNGTANKRSAG